MRNYFETIIDKLVDLYQNKPIAFAAIMTVWYCTAYAVGYAIGVLIRKAFFDR